MYGKVVILKFIYVFIQTQIFRNNLFFWLREECKTIQEIVSECVKGNIECLQRWQKRHSNLKKKEEGEMSESYDAIKGVGTANFTSSMMTNDWLFRWLLEDNERGSERNEPRNREDKIQAKVLKIAFNLL